MRRFIIATLSTLTLLCAPLATHAQAFTNDCTLKFQGSYRKAVKNRVAADGTDYTVHNNGEAISVKDWFEFVCGFDPALKKKKITTSTKELKGFETIKVTLVGFLVGAKFERHVKRGDGKDNDFHLEISDSKQWRSKHVIVGSPRAGILRPAETDIRYCRPGRLRRRQVHSQESNKNSGNRLYFSRWRPDQSWLTSRSPRSCRLARRA
jgi:hypothetical protein